MRRSVPLETQPVSPAGVVAAGTFVLLTFVAIFLAGFNSPAPNRLEVAVTGPPAQVDTLQRQLDQHREGAFELHRYEELAAAREALLARRVQGVFVPSDGARAQLLVASAAGAPIAEALAARFESLAAATGNSLDIDDAKPLPERDSRGLVPFFLVLGTTIVSLLVGGLLHVLGGREPAMRLAMLACAWAVVAGGTTALTADWLADAAAASVSVFGFLSLTAIAVAAPTAAAARLLGPAGIAAAALTMVVLGVSASGGPVGSALQPGFFQTLSEVLPPGAALDALRGALYFDDAGTLTPALVLGVWGLLGLLGLAASGAARGQPGVGMPPQQRSHEARA